MIMYYELERKKLMSRSYRVPFWDRKEIDSNGCWNWVGSKRAHGYGQVYFNGKPARKAHRVAWELTNGKIPNNLCVLHRCDNSSCINPDHLFLGTQLENIQDMINKGRRRPDNIRLSTFATCHPDKPNHAFGLCKICRQRELRFERKLNVNS